MRFLLWMSLLNPGGALAVDPSVDSPPEERKSRYEIRKDHDPDGIGKFSYARVGVKVRFGSLPDFGSCLKQNPKA